MKQKWLEELNEVSHPEKRELLSRFFKTGKGDYAEGDIFIGVTVPDNRKVAIRHFNESLDVIKEMLESPIHEHRLSGFLALVARYKKNKDDRFDIVKFYLKYAHCANNWDLVDLSAPYILGNYLLDNPTPTLLHDLSRHQSLWHRRIAIVATLTLIREDIFEPALTLAERYLTAPEPLIHKATGWVLREIGKHDEPTLTKFLDAHAAKMPRTTLRYAIERLDSHRKKHYMSIKQVKISNFAR